MVVRAVVFDLDDTLYLERSYVESGFRCVALNVADACETQPSSVFDFLWSRFCSGKHGNIFDRLNAKYPSLNQHWPVTQLVELYRSHTPKIQLLPGIADLMTEVKNADIRLGLLTDGIVKSQAAKIAALQLCDHLDSCVLNDTSGIEFRKPHTHGYEAVGRQLGLQGKDIIYVADNPEKDFLGARRAGWKSIRLRIREQLRFSLEPSGADFASDIEANSVSELRSQLKTMLYLELCRSKLTGEN